MGEVVPILALNSDRSYKNNMTFPTKSMMDYINEMQRLFPKTQDNYGATSPQFEQSLYQTVMANKSSSSAESTSPESYSDFQLNQATELFSFSPRPEQRPQNTTPKRVYEQPSTLEYRVPLFNSSHSSNEPTHSLYEPYVSHSVSRSLFDTPVPVRQQRAIVGRKILGNSQLYKSDSKIRDKEPDLIQWNFEDTNQSPPESALRSYELFPPEKHYSPLRRSSFMSSQSNISPSSISHSVSPPNIPTLPQRFPSRNSLNHNFNTPIPINTNYNQYSSSKSDIGSSKMCTFCRKNGETPMVYTTHCVKERVEDRQIVTCPILRSHVCNSCGATGDDAHTITYCPILRSANNGKPLQSTTISLKNTRVKSSGRRRY